jgi:hypothetical protein
MNNGGSARSRYDSRASDCGSSTGKSLQNVDDFIVSSGVSSFFAASFGFKLQIANGQSQASHDRIIPTKVFRESTKPSCCLSKSFAIDVNKMCHKVV